MRKQCKSRGCSQYKFYTGQCIELDFYDEYFDAVFSNYVYRNILGINRQELLLETLLTLKREESLSSRFSKNKYGDIDVFLVKLKEMGYESVELINTT